VNKQNNFKCYLYENSQKASRAAQNALADHMWPAGWVFEIPVLRYVWYEFPSIRFLL